jgi:VWFA-related protein
LWLATIVVAGVLGASPAGQQQPPVFRGGVEKVRIDAIVTHRGRPVVGLTPADFELKDNGVVQEIETATTAGSINLAMAFDLTVSGQTFEELRQSGLALVDALQPADRAWLVTFDNAFALRLGPTGDQQALRQAVVGLRRSGSAAMWDAMFGSVALVKGSGGRSLVVILSDGLDSTSYLDEARTLETLRRGEVVVNAVRGLRTLGARLGGFVHLEAITEATGGRILMAERRDRMAKQFGGLLEEFRLGYILTYSSRPSTRDDGWHKVEIKLKGKNGSVRAREGYFDRGR